MNLPLCRFTSEGIIAHLIQQQYPTKSLAYEAILFCHELLCNDQATVINLRDLRKRYVLYYKIDGIAKELVIKWNTNDFHLFPPRQSAYPEQT